MLSNASVVVLISGRGSNMLALAKSAVGHSISLVLSNQPKALGLVMAKQQGLKTKAFDHRHYANRRMFEQAMITAIDPYTPDLIVLAGFMRLLSPCFIDHYYGRIINIHPALLPAFSGLNTHQRALDAHVQQHGCTVHFVDHGVDSGAIIEQAIVPVLPGDNVQTLSKRVLIAEHRILPNAVKRYLCGDYRLIDNQVRWQSKATHAHI